MKLFHSTMALAVTGTLFAGSAQASVTFISSAFDSAPTAPQVMVVDFDNPNAPGYTITGGEIHITPLVPGIAAPPAGDTTQYLAVLANQTATLTTPGIQSMSVYLGSIDDYNTISFYQGVNLIGSFTGSQLLSPVPALGNQGDAFNNRRFNFDFGGASVNQVVFASSGYSFEFDNIAAPAPEPGIWAMLVVGFGMLGMALRARSGEIAFSNV